MTRRKSKEEKQLEADTNKMVEDFLTPKGLRRATEADKWSVMYPWVLPTPLGDLFLDIRDDAVYCRFDDVRAAVAYFKPDSLSPLNPFSGKYNLHFFDASLDVRRKATEWHFLFLDRAQATAANP